jgi:hypothetical protein
MGDRKERRKDEVHMLKETKNWGNISGWQIFLTLIITIPMTRTVNNKWQNLFVLPK